MGIVGYGQMVLGGNNKMKKSEGAEKIQKSRPYGGTGTGLAQTNSAIKKQEKKE